MSETKVEVNKDMTLGEVVEKYSEAAEVMIKYGLHCVGCHVANWETIEQGAKGHGMDDKTIKKMLDEINQTINKDGKRTAPRPPTRIL